MGDQVSETAGHWEESKRLAEVFYFQYVAQDTSDKAIEAIAELIHYGESDLEKVRQRMAL